MGWAEESWELDGAMAREDFQEGQDGGSGGGNAIEARLEQAAAIAAAFSSRRARLRLVVAFQSFSQTGVCLPLQRWKTLVTDMVLVIGKSERNYRCVR
jgi:hypothetical protein